MEETPTATQDPAAQGDGFRGAAEAAEPTTQAPPTQEGAEAEVTAEESPKNWGDLEKTEWFPAALEERRAAAVEEAKPGIFKEAKSAAMREFDGSHQRSEASLRQIAETGQRMLRAVRQIGEDAQEAGVDPRKFQNALENAIQDNPGFADMMNVQRVWNEGVDSGLKKLAAEAGDEHIVAEMYLKLQNDPGMSDRQFARDFLDRLTEARAKTRDGEIIAKAVEPKDKRIKELEAALAEAKGTSRTGEGADRPQAPAGGLSERERQLDPRTPVSELREIKARQRAGR